MEFVKTEPQLSLKINKLPHKTKIHKTLDNEDRDALWMLLEEEISNRTMLLKTNSLINQCKNKLNQNKQSLKFQIYLLPFKILAACHLNKTKSLK